MVNMQTVDIDKIVEIARKYAAENDWCEVVDEALVEAGLVKVEQYSGTVTFSLNLDNFRIAGDPNGFFDGGEFSLEAYDAEGDWLEGIHDSNLKVRSLDLKKVDSSKTNPDNWWFASRDGRVKHYVRSGNDAVCGAYISPYDRVKISPRSENRNCTRCEAKV